MSIVILPMRPVYPRLTASLTSAIKKKLEDEMGGALFLRDRAGCRLTSLGKVLHPLERISTESRDAKADTTGHARLERVLISIGVAKKRSATAKYQPALRGFAFAPPQAD
jgi:DNA-binding transcriptional LysR family regulator